MGEINGRLGVISGRFAIEMPSKGCLLMVSHFPLIWQENEATTSTKNVCLPLGEEDRIDGFPVSAAS